MATNSVTTQYIPDQTARRINPARSEQNRSRFSTERRVVENSKDTPKRFSDSKPTDDVWLKERTIEELKAVIQAIQLGITDDWQLTDLIFYARHPDLKGTPLTVENQELLDEWNSISAFIVHPAKNELNDAVSGPALAEMANVRTDYNSAVVNSSRSRIDAGSLSQFTTRYDDVIAGATEWCPGLSPDILKSLLAQESAFNPTVINKYGYAGIAQFGKPAAREVGLSVGIAGSSSDERLDPSKAIPGAARLLKIKAQRLESTAFARYGEPQGIEYWKFVTAAYNGGEGTVAVAMGHAYRFGLSAARERGLVGADAVAFAKSHASKWENLKIGGMNSPLGLAAQRYFPAIAAQKYSEIGNYPTSIVARVAGRIR